MEIKETLHAIDDRGTFTNIEMPFEVKRAYIIENNKQGVVRAWHGHDTEKKAFIALSGNWKVCTAKMEVKPLGIDPISENPQSWNRELKDCKEFYLGETKKQILVVEEGMANGLMNITREGKLLVLSSKILEEAIKDDYRFKWDYFGDYIWTIKNR